MKKIPVFIFGLLSISFLIQAQVPYFQQKVAYHISATLLEKEKTIKGIVDLKYFNQSPDTLTFIWFHIWPNAYSSENTALARQLANDKDLKKKIKKNEKGYIDSLSFLVKGTLLKTIAEEDNPDVVKVMLDKPLLPGDSINMHIPFRNKLPGYISRSGESDGQFIACQWYPKPAVYDRTGWHQMPYLDMGEYYAEFGTFDVSITVPADFIVGATGNPLNQDELEAYKTVGKKNHTTSANQSAFPEMSSAGWKTLNYHAENVHDFAWFAQRKYIIQYDTCALASGRVVDVFSYYRPDSREDWIKTVNYLKAGLRFYSSQFGEYPYDQIAAVQGPKNVNSGGMEYSMITLITVNPKRVNEELEISIVHEAGHNWLQGILATNERKYPWFDEGFNTYYQYLYEAQQKKNSVLGKNIPKEMLELEPFQFFSRIMQALAQYPFTNAVNTESADFDSKNDYGVTAYLKGGVWLYILQSRMGQANFEKGIHAYFDEWKFRHPAPEDFKMVMEKACGFDLSNIFDLLNKQGSFF